MPVSALKIDLETMSNSAISYDDQTTANRASRSNPMKNKILHTDRLLAALVVLLGLFAAPQANAQSGTWTNTNTTGANWTNTANWSGGIFAGAIGGTTGTGTATFSNPVATPSQPILITTNINLRTINFETGAGSYTIGTTNGGSLFMSTGSTNQILSSLSTSNTVITINAPLVMVGSMTINNQAANGFGRFVIGGSISAGSASGTNTLTIFSISANTLNTNEITGLMSDGTNGGKLQVIQNTTGGNWYLRNTNNSFTGDLTVQGGNLYVTSIGNQGSNSAAGAGTTINIGSSTSAGSLYYIGSGDTNNRIINMAGTSAGGSIYANGTGMLKLSNVTASGVGSKTLTLRGTNAGEFSGAIVDNATTGSTGTTIEAATTTNRLTLASVVGLTNGSVITGVNIAPGTTIVSINASTRVVTLSTNTEGIVAARASITNSELVNRTSLTKNDAGTWTLSGTNTFTGTTTVSGGTLELKTPSSGALGSTASVAVTNATLLISTSNQVRDGATVSLSGGTIAKGSGAISETFGALTLAANSTLDFGSGTGNFTFSTYNPATFVLKFDNFNPGNSLTVTTGTFSASQFNFNSFDYTQATVGAGFTITAVPEPSTVLAALGLAGLMLWPARRRLFRKADGSRQS